MAFSDNLQFLRTRQGLTQEQLAEQMEVSRQSVSKWESGVSYPEMETLLKLCELFRMDMDTLLRGDAAQALAEDSAGYDSFMTRFARQIAGAVAGIIASVAIGTAVGNLAPVPEAVGAFLLLLGVTVAVVVLIVAGMQYDVFTKRHPVVEDFYTQQDRDEFHRRFIWYIAGGVGAILFAVAAMCLVFSFLPEREPYESAVGTAFLLIVAGAVYSLIYGGMSEDKYNIAKYNRTNTPTEEEKVKRRRAGAACGCIMLLATAIYVGLGLSRNLWGTAWWVFAVGGILCGVAALLLGPRDEDD